MVDRLFSLKILYLDGGPLVSLNILYLNGGPLVSLNILDLDGGSACFPEHSCIWMVGRLFA